MQQRNLRNSFHDFYNSTLTVTGSGWFGALGFQSLGRPMTISQPGLGVIRNHKTVSIVAV